MGTRPFRKVVAGGFLLAALLAGRADGRAQENAVGGAVWSQLDERPLPGVTVSLVQDEKISDTTREQDGFYLLRVPRSLTTFSLSFTHPAYMPKTLRNLKNTETEHKVKPVKLASYQSSSVRRLGDDEINQLIADAEDEVGQAASGSDAALWEAGTTTLRLLVNAAGGFDEQARQEAEAGNQAAAEALLKKSLHIKSRILRAGDPALAGTALAYAELLDRLGRKAEADAMRQRGAFAPPAWRALKENADVKESGAEYYEFRRWQNAQATSTPMTGDKRLVLGGRPATATVFLRGLDVEDFWLTPTSRGQVRVDALTDTADFGVRVVDEAGKIVAASELGAASWTAAPGAAYRVYLINKTSVSAFVPVVVTPAASAPARRR